MKLTEQNIITTHVKVFFRLTITSFKFPGDLAKTFTIRTPTVSSPDFPIYVQLLALLASFLFWVSFLFLFIL